MMLISSFKQTSAHRMELIIIALIAVEVVIVRRTISVLGTLSTNLITVPYS